MARTKYIKETELRNLAEKYPEVGSYDPEGKKLTTPEGNVLELELGKVGRSDPVYVKGAIREYLQTLDIPELQTGQKPAGTSRSTSVSLSEVSHRQVVSPRSWRAWFKQNIHADPQKLKEAVAQGYAQAEEAIEEAREQEKKATREAENAQILKELKTLKKKRSEEELAELLKEA